MAALTHPATRSFFSCGDFNQRLTTWGSRNLREIEWAVPGISTKTIKISYRQSRELNELARALVRLGGGDDADMEMLLPENMINNGVSPVLGEELSGTDVVAAWLAERIAEVESIVSPLPSVAVLVPKEAEVQPLADALDRLLADANIRAVPCLQGQAIGKENDVRVFDIQHIKGLEFEAVFFVGVDRLAKNQPELFDKYLYVGTTRAATYLGVTCDTALPAVLGPLRPMFAKRWTDE